LRPVRRLRCQPGSWWNSFRNADRGPSWTPPISVALSFVFCGQRARFACPGKTVRAGGCWVADGRPVRVHASDTARLATARRGLRLEHRALLVERGEQAGHVEQVGTEPVRLGGLADAGEDHAETEQLQRERALGTRGDRYPALRGPHPVGAAEDRPDPRGRVL